MSVIDYSKWKDIGESDSDSWLTESDAGGSYLDDIDEEDTDFDDDENESHTCCGGSDCSCDCHICPDCGMRFVDHHDSADDLSEDEADGEKTDRPKRTVGLGADSLKKKEGRGRGGEIGIENPQNENEGHAETVDSLSEGMKEGKIPMEGCDCSRQATKNAAARCLESMGTFHFDKPAEEKERAQQLQKDEINKAFAAPGFDAKKAIGGASGSKSHSQSKSVTTATKKTERGQKKKFSSPNASGDRSSITTTSNDGKSQPRNKPGFLAKPKGTKNASNSNGKLSEDIKADKALFELFKRLAQPVYVKCHPDDMPMTLEPVFFEHPRDFIPEKNEDGIYTRWGIPMPQGENYINWLQTRMMAGNFYKCNPDWPMSPEQQFVDYLRNEKEKKLDRTSTEFLNRDFVLKISMKEIKPEIWRRVKVSGAMNLNTLQDKVITPVMGWTRNYHGYMYTDQTDGTVYGPMKCDAIDIGCWKGLFAIEFYDDTKVPLGLVLQKEGDWLLYEYDLGDHWEHDIVVEKILSAEESTGSCELLAGAMRCPPEDSNGCDGKGNDCYQDLLDMLPPQRIWKGSRSQTLSSKVKRMLMEAETAMNISPDRFNPYEFNLAEKQKNLKMALTSRSSVRDGSKKMIAQLQPGAPSSRFTNSNQRAGELLLRKEDGPWRFMEEKTSLRRDEIDLALCHHCGNPNNLKLCTGCRMIRYCSRGCQKADWSVGHRKECRKLQLQHDQVKAEMIAEKKKNTN